MSKKPVRVCVVGSANMDLTARSDRLPLPGETLPGHDFHVGFGGKGANQAVMATRLGANVSFIGKVGADDFGKQLMAHLHGEAIDTTHILSNSKRATGVAVIIVDSQGRNCIVVVPGANLDLTSGDIESAATLIQTADVVIGQFEVPVEATLAAFRLAKAAGVRTILNPAPARPIPAELLQCTAVCVPNETERTALCGEPVTTVEAARAARILRHCPPAWIITLGQHGAIVVNNDGAEHIPALPVNAVDTTGAGDAFIGSLAVFWAEGQSLVDATRRACAVAAVSVTRKGTQTSFPTRAELSHHGSHG
jgi:ribokinase